MMLCNQTRVVLQDKPVICAANQNGSLADCELGNPFKRDSEVSNTSKMLYYSNLWIVILIQMFLGNILYHIEHWQDIARHQRGRDRPSAGNVCLKFQNHYWFKHAYELIHELKCYHKPVLIVWGLYTAISVLKQDEFTGRSGQSEGQSQSGDWTTSFCARVRIITVFKQACSPLKNTAEILRIHFLTFITRYSNITPVTLL